MDTTSQRQRLSLLALAVLAVGLAALTVGASAASAGPVETSLRTAIAKEQRALRATNKTKLRRHLRAAIAQLRRIDAHISQFDSGSTSANPLAMAELGGATDAELDAFDAALSRAMTLDRRGLRAAKLSAAKDRVRAALKRKKAALKMMTGTVNENLGCTPSLSFPGSFPNEPQTNIDACTAPLTGVTIRTPNSITNQTQYTLSGGGQPVSGDCTPAALGTVLRCPVAIPAGRRFEVRVATQLSTTEYIRVDLETATGGATHFVKRP